MDKETKRGLIKMAVSAIVAIGADIIVDGVIKHNVPNVKGLGKICVLGAKIVACFMAEEACSQYTDKLVEDVFTAVDMGTAVYDVYRKSAATSEVTVQ